MARVRYVGPDGARNLDVARETGGSARLVSGRDYEVSDDLARRLTQSTRAWVESPPELPVRPAVPATPAVNYDQEEGDDGAL